MTTLSDQSIKVLANVITGNENRSPYRSGPKLVKFFNDLGWADVYENFPARHTYVETKLQEINGTATLEKIIRAATDPRNFLNTGFEPQDIINYLNQYLIYDGYEVVKDGVFFKVAKRAGSNAKQGKPIKNLIFASTGYKPEIVLQDATTNDIRIVKNKDQVLVYDREIHEHGLLLGELVDWWVEQQGIASQDRATQQGGLLARLLHSLGDNGAEKALFYVYISYVFGDKGSKLPALIPQVYLHYDPYTIKQLAGQKNLPRQRMDFLMLFPNNVKVVIEIDGKQHYATGDRADPRLYAEMVAEDRRLKLAGYEVFRFGGQEFVDTIKATQTIREFFDRLFEVHSVFD